MATEANYIDPDGGIMQATEQGAELLHPDSGIFQEAGAAAGGWSHKFNGIAGANIAKINGVAIASIAKVNGVA